MIIAKKKTITLNDGKTISLLINNVTSPKAQLIFAHGAGADMNHEFMEKFTVLLNSAKFNVIRFNFPFMDKRQLTQKKYPPDKMPQLIDCYRAVIDYVFHHEKTDIPLVIGGKSMGSRVAVILMGDKNYVYASPLNKVQAVFCLGYPFHPQKKPDKLRLSPLVELDIPALIIQGTRDALGNQTEISGYELRSNCKVVFLEDGDHSLKPRVKSGFTHAGHMVSAATALCDFIHVNTKVHNSGKISLISEGKL